jgi:predicted enzyme related to lactoylglutathione lyase
MADKQGRVRGIGGVFFRSQDPQATCAWYEQHLGLKVDAYGTNFEWRQADSTANEPSAYTQWSPFKESTDYFGEAGQQYMINYRVDDLDALLETLRKSGVKIAGSIHEEPFGRFVHIIDGDGRRLELWEPVDASYADIVDGVTR